MKIGENKIFSLFGLVIIGLAALGQFQRIQLTTSLAIYLHDLAIISWLGIVWTNYAQKKQLSVTIKKILLKREVVLGLIWLSLGWIWAVIQAADLLVVVRPLFYLLRLSLVVIFSQILMAKLELSWPKFGRQILQFGSLGFGFLILLWGLLQYYFLPDTRFLKTFGWDDHYFRLISTLFDPGFTGLILSLTLIGWLGWLKAQLQNLAKFQSGFKFIWWLIWGFLIVGILLTYSRATYLAVFSGLIWLTWKSWRKNQKSLVIFCAASLGFILAGLPLLPTPTGEGVNLQRTSTITSRVSATQAVITDLSPAQWWLGKGLFVNSNPKTDHTNLPDHAQLPDNLFITLISGLGLGGMLVGLKLWGTRLVNQWQTFPNWLQAIWITTLIHSLFNNSLFQPQVWLIIQLWTASRF